MKFKYVLPMLAGLALVSCSQDDEFASNSVGKEYSPVTFAVSMESGEVDTRAWVLGTDGRYSKYAFDSTDLLSLWNGMGSWNSSDKQWVSIGSNAVFAGKTDEDGAMVFKTISMVEEGTAIMVYPADTCFTNKRGDVLLGVPMGTFNLDDREIVLDAEDVDAIPYVSDFIKIGEYNDKTGAPNTAGYGRRYDIVMRQAAGLLMVKMNAEGKAAIDALTDVAPITYTKVSMNDGGADDNARIFPWYIKLEGGTGESPVNTNDPSTTTPRTYAHYADSVVIVPGDDPNFKAHTVTTTCIETVNDGADTYAYFVVAPFKTKPSVGDAAYMKVYTTYGTVTVKNVENTSGQDSDGPLQGGSSNNRGKNLKENLENALVSTWQESTGLYKKSGQKNVGSRVGCKLTFDLKNLEMDGTEIKDSKQLIDILKVYRALSKTGGARLVLAGAGGNFDMTAAALDQLALVSDIKLDVKTNNQTITLVDNDPAAPTLTKLANTNVKFVDDSSKDATAKVILSDDVDWTLDQSYTNSNISEIESKGNLKFTNKNSSSTAFGIKLVLADGASMTFEGTSFDLGVFAPAKGSTVTIGSATKRQKVTMNGRTDLRGTVTNYGYMVSKAEVLNWGTIENNFEVSVMEGANEACIRNVGTIKNNGANAVTYITYNGSINYKGRIVLTNRKDNVSIKDKTNYPGYVVWNVNASDEYTYEAETGDVFNWINIEVSGDVPTVTLNSNVKYLTVDGDDVVVTTNGTINVTDLFVEKSIRLLGSNAINATGKIYVGDYILHSGNLSGTKSNSYASGVYGETAVSYNGEIRTVSNN